MFRLLLIIIVLAGVAAYLTKPSQADVEAQIRSLIGDAITAGQLDDVTDPAAMVLLATCQANPAGCAELALAAMDVRYEDRVIYARIDVAGFGRQAVCYGLYTRLVCPRGLSAS